MNRNFQMSQQYLNPSNDYIDSNMNRVAVTSVQQVADRAFYRRAGVWVDSRLVASRKAQQPQRILRFGSKEFRALAVRLARENRQGSIALVGDILMEVDGKPVLVKGPARK